MRHITGQLTIDPKNLEQLISGLQIQIPGSNQSITSTGHCNNRSKITSSTRLHYQGNGRDFGNVARHSLPVAVGTGVASGPVLVT